ncbi:hypothetical protein NPIL_578201 [Nephila pilipes]|uniref:Uncharacterized protein n=1 Tax=Nephila pilipes TaxID=299642 RepID=A0A8X6P888_NEPPI|nr:hypothetical protein NPIL_578201 [Nephila pilipes]
MQGSFPPRQITRISTTIPKLNHSHPKLLYECFIGLPSINEICLLANSKKRKMASIVDIHLHNEGKDKKKIEGHPSEAPRAPFYPNRQIQEIRTQTQKRLRHNH